jgi:hypothetical protein
MRNFSIIIALFYALSVNAQTSVKTIYSKKVSGLLYGGVTVNFKTYSNLSTKEKTNVLLLDYVDFENSKPSSIALNSNAEKDEFIKDMTIMKELLDSKQSDLTVLAKPNYSITVLGGGIMVMELAGIDKTASASIDTNILTSKTSVTRSMDLIKTSFTSKGTEKLLVLIQNIDIDNGKLK